MSRIAGIILIVMGLAIAVMAARELYVPPVLTRLAIWSTILIGILLALAGLAHFRAPHKAFLITIPLLLYLLLQTYVNFIHYFNQPRWTSLAFLFAASILILVLSYRGYLESKAAHTSI